MAVSLLGQSGDQSVKDTNAVQSMLSSTKTSIVTKFREIAANSTNTALGETLTTLARTGNDTQIINFLVVDLKAALKRVNYDAAVARDVNDKRKAQFEAYLAAADRDARRAQANLVALLEKTIREVQGALNNKTRDLAMTDT
jgi:hypothetical protein